PPHDDDRAARHALEAPLIAAVVPRDLPAGADHALRRHRRDHPDRHTATLKVMGGCGSYPVRTKCFITVSVSAARSGSLSRKDWIFGSIASRGSARGARSSCFFSPGT